MRSNRVRPAWAGCALACVFAAGNASGQDVNRIATWSWIEAERGAVEHGLRARRYAACDEQAWRAVLERAPLEHSGEAPVEIELPMTEGVIQRFEAWNSPIMAPELAAKYPQIQTFVVRGVDDRSAIGRLDISDAGTHAFIRRDGETVLVSAVPGRAGEVACRFGSDLSDDWECGVRDVAAVPAPRGGGYEPRSAVSLRTYRLAAACTGEFGVYHSQRQGRAPNVSDALSAVVTIVNRVNAVFETDMGVRFELVPNNDALVFIDPASDPYDGEESGANLLINGNVLNTRIGLAHYDIGHVLTRIPGGVANLQCACGSQKANGVSGVPRTDDGDPLSGLVPMHELGHQYGANHTFNGNVDRCSGNRSSSSAWEPGSGSTIMAYAGNCPVGNNPPGDNLQPVRDTMFHLGSILEMRGFIQTISQCGVLSATGNNAPMLTTFPGLTGLTIPRLTPFELRAMASDSEQDPLVYSWEEVDIGPQQSLASVAMSDNGFSSRFRVFRPITSSVRHVPKIEHVLAGTVSRGEYLPAATGTTTRRFRLAVRDQHPGGGGVTISPMLAIDVNGAAGPFVVTQPASQARLRPGLNVVRWNVAGTASAPINTALVRITLSTDGGASFPIVLASSDFNDGETTVNMPSAESSDCRVRVEAIGNIYMAYSGAFSLRTCEPDYNQDGGTDTSDILDLATDVAQGTQSFPPSAPDFNQDGNHDNSDVFDLVNVVAGGVCP